MRKPPLLLPLLLAASLPCQSRTFIVPSQDILGNSMAAKEGNFWDLANFWVNGPAWPGPMRIQHLWPVADIPVPVAYLNLMEFRRSHAIASANPAATATVAVDISVGPNTVAGRSTTFTANHGTNQQNVFSGNLNLPNLPAGSGLPPFTVPIPFAAPFVYVGAMGQTLVVEFAVTAYNPTTSNATWYLDAVKEGAGTYTTNLSNAQCKFSNGKNSTLNGIGVPKLGGTWYAAYGSGLPAQLAAVGFLGPHGMGGIWAGVALPFDLGPLGAPGCFLAASIYNVQVLTELTPGYYTWGNGLPVPNDPALAGAVLYDQGLWVDPAANALGLVLGISTKWTVGSGVQPSGAKLYQYYVSGAPKPSATTGYSSTVTTIARFSY